MTSSEKGAKRRPFYVWVLIILVFILAISALISGLILFIEPDGSLLWMPTDVLENSPFNDFLVPGIILFIFLGVFPFIVGLGLVNTSLRWMVRANPFKGHYWAWTGAILTGIILLIFIIVEIAVLGYISVLQPIMGVWGALILCLTLLPRVRRYYRAPAVPFTPKKLY